MLCRPGASQICKVGCAFSSSNWLSAWEKLMSEPREDDLVLDKIHTIYTNNQVYFPT